MANNLVVEKDGSISLEAISTDPVDPEHGFIEFWVSDGTGTGPAGDLMLKSTVGFTTKTVNLSGLLTGGATEIRLVDTLPGTPESGVVYLLRP